MTTHPFKFHGGVCSVRLSQGGCQIILHPAGLPTAPEEILRGTSAGRPQQRVHDGWRCGHTLAPSVLQCRHTRVSSSVLRKTFVQDDAKLLKPGSCSWPLVSSTVLHWITCQPSTSSWVLTLCTLLLTSVWDVRCGIGSLGPAWHTGDGQTGHRESSRAEFDLGAPCRKHPHLSSNASDAQKCSSRHRAQIDCSTNRFRNLTFELSDTSSPTLEESYRRATTQGPIRERRFTHISRAGNPKRQLSNCRSRVRLLKQRHR